MLGRNDQQASPAVSGAERSSMSRRIVAYLPTAASRDLTDQLAGALGCGVSRIEAPRYEGVTGQVRMALDAIRGRRPEIAVDPRIGSAIRLVLVSPVWLGGLAPPVRAFLDRASWMPPVSGLVLLWPQAPGSGYRIETELADCGLPFPPVILQVGQVGETLAPGRLGAFADTLARAETGEVNPRAA